MIEWMQDGPVARMVVNRPLKKNAFDQAMWQSLLQHCEQLRHRAEAPAAGSDTPRVLLLQGQPGAFCAGADIGELQQLLAEADPAAMAASNAVVSQAQAALAALPMPTVAVIDGPCFGGGFGLAAACDFRLGSDRARFGITPSRLGLLYGLADTRRLATLVGHARARRLLLRTEMLDAPTALDWGVLDACVPADALADLAQGWAQHLAAQSRVSMAGIKATLAHLAGEPGDTPQSLQQRFDAAFDNADFAEGAAAFLERRAPRF